MIGDWCIPWCPRFIFGALFPSKSGLIHRHVVKPAHRMPHPPSSGNIRISNVCRRVHRELHVHGSDTQCLSCDLRVAKSHSAPYSGGVPGNGPSFFNLVNWKSLSAHRAVTTITTVVIARFEETKRNKSLNKRALLFVHSLSQTGSLILALPLASTKQQMPSGSLNIRPESAR